jgi:hypothetical protein
MSSICKQAAEWSFNMHDLRTGAVWGGRVPFGCRSASSAAFTACASVAAKARCTGALQKSPISRTEGGQLIRRVERPGKLR